MLKLLIGDQPKLRERSKEVGEITPEILRLAKEMFDITKKENGIGLSAIQVGEAIRLFVMELKPSRKSKLPKIPRTIVINPKILEKSGETKVGEEGCLCFPNIFGDVKRAERIRLEYLDETGKKRTQTFTGFKARVVQHELDHLNGVLFIDKAKDLWTYAEPEEK